MKKILEIAIKNWFPFCLGLTLLLGFALRFYRIGQIPTSLYWDETAMLVDAKSIVQTGKDMHSNAWFQAMFPSYGDYKLPVYIWLATITVKVFGVTEFSLRLPSAVLGTIQILLLGWFSQRVIFSDRKSTQAKVTFLFVSTITALTPWSILFSRTGFEGFIGQFLLLISMCLLWLYFDEKRSSKKILFFCLTIIFGALSVYAYYSVRFVWPVLFIASFFLFELPQKWKNGMKAIISSIVFFLIGLFLWWGLLSPLINSPFYEASQQFRLSTSSLLNEDFAEQSNHLRELSGNGVFARIFYHRYVLLGTALAKNYATHLNLNFLFINGDANLRHGTGNEGLFQWWMMIGFFSGIYALFFKHRRVLVLMLLWWLIALLPASVPTTVPHALRSLNALSPLVVIIGVGFAQITHYLQRKYSYVLGYFVRMILLLMLLLSIPFFHDYFKHYPNRSASDWQDGYKQLALFVNQQKNEYKNIWINPDDDRLYLWLMAYGSYSGNDFQSWKSKKYQFPEIENIHFQEFYWERLFSIDGKILVITKPGQLEKEPQRLTEIKDSTGVIRFVAAEYSNK